MNSDAYPESGGEKQVLEIEIGPDARQTLIEIGKFLIGPERLRSVQAPSGRESEAASAADAHASAEKRSKGCSSRRTMPPRRSGGRSA